jgi:hypothetical protein
MARSYTIRSGCSFRRDDGSLATGGESIELEDDVAAAHAEKVEPVVAVPPEEPGEGEAEPAEPPAEA